MCAEFRAAFDLFDQDGNNAISKEELGTVMRRLGLNPTDEELRDMIVEQTVEGQSTGRSPDFAQVEVKRSKSRSRSEDLKHETRPDDEELRNMTFDPTCQGRCQGQGQSRSLG